MAKNVVGLFMDPTDAQSAMGDLQSAGFTNNANLIRNASGQFSTLSNQLGIPQNDANVYMQALQQGAAMVVVQQLDDSGADQVVRILDRNNVADIEDVGRYFQRSSTTTSTQSSGMATSGMQSSGMQGYQASAAGRSSSYMGGETVIPIVEEEIQIGKREVETGGVRVQTRVEERPVNEQVTLRDEEVHVERRRVTQPLDGATAATAFQEGVVEMREHDEQAVVQKEARVVEEVVVGKEVQQRTETVQDTVRRTDVDVQQVGGQQVTGVQGTTTSTGFTGGTSEGAIEGGASSLGNAAERAIGTDIDRDGDVGQRDPRNNI